MASTKMLLLGELNFTNQEGIPLTKPKLGLNFYGFLYGAGGAVGVLLSLFCGKKLLIFLSVFLYSIGWCALFIYVTDVYLSIFFLFDIFVPKSLRLLVEAVFLAR